MAGGESSVTDGTLTLTIVTMVTGSIRGRSWPGVKLTSARPRPGARLSWHAHGPAWACRLRVRADAGTREAQARAVAGKAVFVGRWSDNVYFWRIWSQHRRSGPATMNRLPWVLCAILGVGVLALSRYVWLNKKLVRRPSEADDPERWNEFIVRVWISGVFALMGSLMIASGIYVAVTI